jgi:EpsI family protein
MMDRPLLRSIALTLSLTVAATLGTVLKPHGSMAARLPTVDLQRMVPAEFADWRADTVRSAGGVPDDIQAELARIYSQVLDRVYVNSAGQRVMLSIAYGRDQDTNSQLHRPEFCYEAQGFQVSATHDGSLSTDFGSIPVRRMIASRGARIEPVTYWITVGDRVTLPGIGRKLVQLSYGLTGRIDERPGGRGPPGRKKR